MFNRNDQDDNVYFYLALTNYIYIVTEEKFDKNMYSKETLEFQLDLINKNLEGNIKQFAITKIFSEFDKHLITENLDFLQDKIEIYLPQIDDEKYKIVLQKMNRRLSTINNQLDVDVYESTLLNLEGDNIALKEVLQIQGDKIKIIDFWASWCGPCINEIKKNQWYREKLTQEKNIEFIYLSIDKNKDKWRNKVTELKEFGMVKNQYLIPESNSSVLRNFFNISSIPHYAILDRNNDVYLINAPSPGNTSQFNDIIKRIETLELK